MAVALLWLCSLVGRVARMCSRRRSRLAATPTREGLHVVKDCLNPPPQLLGPLGRDTGDRCCLYAEIELGDGLVQHLDPCSCANLQNHLRLQGGLLKLLPGSVLLALSAAGHQRLVGLVRDAGRAGRGRPFGLCTGPSARLGHVLGDHAAAIPGDCLLSSSALRASVLRLVGLLQGLLVPSPRFLPLCPRLLPLLPRLLLRLLLEERSHVGVGNLYADPRCL
mmetsp:Transcript_13731/g.32532  ORF Transcript_13731/g.32532 Transcript_13731/m.32532 type:complete len:222 (-) Transcript_13731:710-1375(-)